MRGKRVLNVPKTGHSLGLTYRGLEWCDGCGAKLDPADRLAGLCPECSGAGVVTPVVKPEQTRR